MKRTAHDKYNVNLNKKEHHQVQQIITCGVSNARVNTRARILLAAHAGEQDKEICEIFHVSRSTVHDTRQHYCAEGLHRALYDLPRSGQPRKLSGTQEAHVIAIACTRAPEGYVHWTMDLLTEKVEEKLAVSISRSAVYNVLLRNDTKPWLKKMWVISEITPEFVEKMNEVLEVYERPYNRKKPVVCMDERSKQLLKETRTPKATKPGKAAKADYEYERNGTCNIFVAVEPKGKKRAVRVTEHRTMEEYAYFLKHLVDDVYKNAEKVILVEDNLNIHHVSSLITIFGEAEGKRVAEKIEWHWTPKHASWLDIAEIEIHSLGGAVP